MANRARTARLAHTKQKPKPRLVSKAHRLELEENLSDLQTAQRAVRRTEQSARRARRA